MVVQHNLTAMNSNRMLGLTTSTQAKATEKLSSGYKINRAADDAAGLAISEKMRKQIRGLTQASLNAQDGISAVQTAEGALNEVEDMLQRMNELAVKSANGTNSSTDRNAIQAEIDQLSIEIDRVSTTTKFNETYLLKGVDTDGRYNLKFTTASGAKNDLGFGQISDKFDGNGRVSVAVTNSVADASTGLNKSYTYLNAKGSATLTACVSGKAVSFTTASKSFYLFLDDTQANINKALTTASQVGFSSKDEFLMAVKSAVRENDKSGSLKGLALDTSKMTYTIDVFADKNKDLNFSLHVGADSERSNKIDLDVKMLSARGLGVNALRVNGENDVKATDAIDTIAAALQTVSTQRANLGAVQNRLEHTINNLDNVVENTQSAESAIRDTDMATQMVQYSNNNILAQAGQAMLAQSNQANQGVLSLLG